MRVLHLISAISLNPGAFRATWLVEELRDRGHDVLVRAVWSKDRSASVAMNPQIPNDPFDNEEFKSFAPEVIISEGSLVGGSSEWKVPEPLVLDFVESGGVILVVDVSRFQLQLKREQEQLGFFGVSLGTDLSEVPYLDDPDNSAGSGQLLISPEDMAVDVLLEPAFEGVESIQAWGAVALVVTGYIAATAAWSARTLVDDRFVGDGPSPFAAVKEYGFGFAAIVAASVAADVVSSNAGTVTS